jgi:hypothetical protein
LVESVPGLLRYVKPEPTGEGRKYKRGVDERDTVDNTCVPEDYKRALTAMIPGLTAGCFQTPTTTKDDDPIWSVMDDKKDLQKLIGVGKTGQDPYMKVLHYELQVDVDNDATSHCILRVTPQLLATIESIVACVPQESSSELRANVLKNVGSFQDLPETSDFAVRYAFWKQEWVLEKFEEAWMRMDWGDRP